MKRYFSCSSLSEVLCNEVSIGESEAYWHINISLINRCGTHKNNARDLSFKILLVNSPNYNCYKKVNKLVKKKKIS